MQILYPGKAISAIYPSGYGLGFLTQRPTGPHLNLWAAMHSMLSSPIWNRHAKPLAYLQSSQRLQFWMCSRPSRMPTFSLQGPIFIQYLCLVVVLSRYMYRFWIHSNSHWKHHSMTGILVTSRKNMVLTLISAASIWWSVLVVSSRYILKLTVYWPGRRQEHTVLCSWHYIWYQRQS